MQYKTIPVRGQKFDIGRTINPCKCDCERCDFMHCPKNNYCVITKQYKYTTQEFIDGTKEEIKTKGGLHAYLLDMEGLADFMDACVGDFPKGTYWNPTGYSLELVVMNRSKYGPDFIERAEIELDSANTFPIRYYQGCTDTQEKFAKKLQKKFLELKESCRNADVSL